MADEVAGLILAALDVDVGNLASWNRWYDLEHLAPNIALPGIITGRRYVATPELHDSRICDPDDPAWGSGRSVFLTWYATSIDPGEAIGAMASRRDELEAEGRMAGAGARVVRTGDALRPASTWADPALRLDEPDLVHVEHLGLRLIVDHDDRVASGAAPVVASLRFASVFQPGLAVELQLLSTEARAALTDLRAAESPRRDLVLDAGFDLIHGLRYPFIAAIETSSLPRTIED